MTLCDYLNDARKIARLGLPIIAGQAGMIVVGFADNIMVGRYSTEALASASFVNNVFNMANLACLGFTYGITPLVGALFGRGERGQIGSLMRNALLLNMLYALFICTVMTGIYLNIHLLGQPEELLPLIKPYYLLNVAGLLFITLYNVAAQACYGMRDTAMPMWVILGTNALNVGGNWLLIYGNCGAPELGLFGAGLATLAAKAFSALILMLYMGYAAGYADVRHGFHNSRLQRGTLARLFKTSLPVSLQLLFETAAFSGAAIMAGWLGKVELAAFQVMVTIGTLGFCFYYSLGSATSVLVANAAGRNDHPAMRRVGFAGYGLTLLMAIAASLTFIFAGRYLIGLFTNDEAVTAMAMTLIAPMVLYQLGDATQVNFANSLRGTSRVLSMLWIALVSYIIIGIPTTFMLRSSIQGIFYSFSASLFVAGALFLYFFLKNTRETSH